MSVLTKIAARIIQEQEGIIGPIAIEQAQKVQGLKLNWAKKEVSIVGDENKILDELVDKYKHLFGQASVEVCREAAKELLSELPKDKKPKFLS